MAKVPIQALREAIRSVHGCEATFVQADPVVERGRGSAAWDDAVRVFDRQGHSTAKQSYAWSHEAGDGGQRRLLAVRHSPTVDSPESAVRASIAADHRRA